MGVRLRFEILGPLRCFADAHEVPMSSPRERTVLAMLLLGAGEPVPAAVLVDAVWGELLPRNARGQLQSSIWRLRGQLAEAGGSRDLVATDPIGYRVQVGAEELDLLKFRQLRDEARVATTTGDPARANDNYRAALALWRGPTLTGFDNSAVRDHAVALDEEYLQALEGCITIELERGKEGELVPELTRCTHQYPYREKLHGALILALYRTGRQADALAAYQRARQLLQDDVGVEPGDDLQKLHKAVLNRDPTLKPVRVTATGGDSVAFTPAKPRMLPADIPDFVGRASEMESVRTLLTQPAGSAVPVAIIAGPAGVGKTALSVHLAHGLRDAYPDGQLYANLRGYDQAGPTHALNVLGRFLRALGVDGGNLGSTLDERAELYRNLTADRRILVVLDNAAAGDQVLPLVPGGQPCGVIINSRAPLDGVLGSHVLLKLGPLDERAAAALVGAIAGADRVSAEPDALTELVHLCGHLPLAVRVAAGKLAAKPHWTVGRLVHQLRDERKRLDYLSRGSLDVRASISLSYAGLSTDAQRLLRRLCDLEFGSVTSWLPAALLDVTLTHAEQALEELFDAQLIDVVGSDATGRIRYRSHELVRLYAKERAEAEELPDDLAAARTRMLGAWLYLSDRAYERLDGVDDYYLTIHSTAPRWILDEHITTALIKDPQTWFEGERQNLIAAVQLAAARGLHNACWDLVSTISPLFRLRRRFDDWHLLLDPALAAARESADDVAVAAILKRLGELYIIRQEFSRAGDLFQRSAALFLQCDHAHGHAAATAHLAMTERFVGRHEEAERHYAEALPTLQATSDRGGEALVLRSIGQIYLDRDDGDRAEAHFALALERYCDLRWRRGEAQTRFWLGMLRLKQSRYEQAIDLFIQVLRHSQEVADRSGEIQALRGIGLSYIRTGDLDLARDTLTEALHLAAQPRPTLLERYVRQTLHELEKVVRRPDARTVDASAGRDSVA